MPNPTAKSFGTKVRVISLTEVAAWRMPIIKPTSRPKPSIGDATNTTTNSACLPISITDATSIFSPTVLFSYGKAKLAAKLPIIKLQPSMSTNSISLNGIDIIIGESIIIPIDIKTLATTISIMMKGM